MPAHAHPTATRVGDNRVVHIQRHDRRTANRRQTYYLRSRRIPGKVLAPRLVAWVKEGDDLARQGVTGCGCATLELVATPAGKAEIVKCGWTALCLRDDVVNRHRLPRVCFCGVTIRASPIIGGEKALSQVDGELMSAHAAPRSASAGGTW